MKDMADFTAIEELTEPESCQITSYMLRNVPVILKSEAKSWKISHSLQSTQDSVQALLDIFDDQEVQVEQSGCCRRKMKLSEFRSLCCDGRTGLYVKDWHAFLTGQHRDLYNIPRAFRDDWFNWYFKVSGQSVDYRFIYVGGLESITHTHHDVICSYSWSVNVKGRKMW